MNTKMLVGMYNAPKNKRYKSFAVQAADSETVWALAQAEGEDVVRRENVYVWPMKEFVKMYRSSAIAVEMDVHDFMEVCRARMEQQDFIIHVFANGADSCDVYASELLERLQEELDLVE